MTRDDPVLVTGAAGFIGHAVARRLLARGERVIGIDIVDDYYDPALKEARLATLQGQAGFRFARMDIADADPVAELVRSAGVVRIVHLAAQAGVRHGIAHPFAYERSNVRGHLSVLEASRHAPGFEHLVYASSSSVYGNAAATAGEARGFSEDDPAGSPISLYAATKRSAELMSESYAALYGFAQSGLRFFTVYGPWGRPDMAIFGFTRKILAGEPIEVFGGGAQARDFTYIDDVVDGVIGVLDRPPARGVHRLLNVGNSHPVGLLDMIAMLERALGVQAVKAMRPMQPGDVTATWADVSRIHALTGYRARTMLADGLARFVEWYRAYQAGMAAPSSDR